MTGHNMQTLHSTWDFGGTHGDNNSVTKLCPAALMNCLNSALTCAACTHMMTRAPMPPCLWRRPVPTAMALYAALRAPCRKGEHQHASPLLSREVHVELKGKPAPSQAAPPKCETVITPFVLWLSAVPSQKTIHIRLICIFSSRMLCWVPMEKQADLGLSTFILLIAEVHCYRVVTCSSY